MGSRPRRASFFTLVTKWLGRASYLPPDSDANVLSFRRPIR